MNYVQDKLKLKEAIREYTRKRNYYYKNLDKGAYSPELTINSQDANLWLKEARRLSNQMTENCKKENYYNKDPLIKKELLQLAWNVTPLENERNRRRTKKSLKADGKKVVKKTRERHKKERKKKSYSKTPIQKARLRIRQFKKVRELKQDFGLFPQNRKKMHRKGTRTTRRVRP